MNLALSLDLGTTSIAAAAVDERGRLVAVVRVPNSAAVTGLPGEHAEQDPVQLRALVLQALTQLAGQIDGTPHCLGLTGQMHGVLFVDGEQQPLTNLITWQDRRANSTVPDGSGTYLEALLSRCDAAAIESTGCRPAPGYLAVTGFVLAQQQQLPQTTATASLIVDWIAAQLTGETIVTDPSNAASTGAFDIEHGRWSQPLLGAAGLAETWMPEVRESGIVIGQLSAEAAAATGLPAGLPVCNALGDNQAAVLGSVPAGDPAIQINVGTGGQINWPIEQFQRVDGMDTRYLPAGRLMLVGAGLAGGDAYAWVQRTAARWLEELGAEASSEDIYRRMNALAAAIPRDAAGLVCRPLFRGTRRDPQARGEFAGITPENFSLGHVARSVLQGIADGLYSFYAGAADARPAQFERIIGSGNGLRKNRLLTNIIAETFGRPVYFPGHIEEAAVGAALLAGANTGMWGDLEAAGKYICLVNDE